MKLINPNPADPFIIENVIFSENKTVLELVSTVGDILKFQLEGDCCSNSFFDEDTVLDVKTVLGESLVSADTIEEGTERDDVVDEIIHYALKLQTDRQLVTLMWRNENNGYYAGYVDIYFNGQKVKP